MAGSRVSRDMSQVGHVSAAETAVIEQVAPADTPMQALALLVVTGDARGTSHRLTGPFTAGRDERSDLVLVDAGASREHLRVTPTRDGIEVADLDSRNGTFVDGRRITKTVIEPPCFIRAGETLLRICHLAEEWTAATPSGPLVGGTALAPARRLITLVGPTKLAVLIRGETGTGKEVAARLLHVASRRSGPFVAVNCAALPETLVESELFGHSSGAYTGARGQRKGLFAAAAGGTLFLDEVGDVPASVQAKLLRVLEDGQVRPVGTDASFAVDVRVLSATNRDLAVAVSEGRFRSDLLARLAGVELRLPPLRERPEDIPALAAYLLDRFDRGALVPDGNALEALLLYRWPQNIRELDNVLRQAALGCAGGTLSLADLPDAVGGALTRIRGHQISKGDESPAGTRARLEEALHAHQGNVRRVGQTLGIARSQVYRLLARWNLDPDSFR